MHPEIRALAKRGDVGALVARLDSVSPPAADSLGESHPLSEQAVIAVALGGLKDVSAVPALAACLDPELRIDLRAHASHALRQIGGHAAADALRPYLGDEWYAIRADAVEAISKHPRADDAPKLAALVANDRFWQLRCRASEVLGQTRNDSAIPTLRTAVERDRILVSGAAAYGLRLVDSVAARATLKELSKTAPGMYRRFYCRRQLRRAARKRK